MKVVGTIVEYNPLHNGHVYAIDKIKQESNADIIVAVMSGDFTMRGELSLFNKFEKTKQALYANVDIVIELPFIYTVQNSDLFAKYSIHLLKLAKVDEIWIGSENNDSAIYEKYYNDWINEDNQNKIKELIKEGISYKKATTYVINLPSNDLLGFSYYKALKELNYNIPLKTIQRVGVGYYDLIPKEFASAYSIRKDMTLADKYCPNYVNIENIRDSNRQFKYIKFNILNSSPEQIKKIFLVSEGIEHKLFSITNFDNIDDYVNHLVSKRYTRSRIQRILLYILLNLNKDFVNKYLNELPDFIRILGYTETGLSHIKTIKKEVTIYTNIKNNINEILDINLKISRLLDLIYETDQFSLEQSKPITK